MRTFTERMSLAPAKTQLQTTELDTTTRHRIENLLNTIAYTNWSGTRWIFDDDVLSWIDRILKRPISSFSPQNVSQSVQSVVQKSEWHIVLSTVEHFINTRSHKAYQGRKLNLVEQMDAWNTLFEEEGVGYRFYDGQLLPIVEPEQATAILSSSTDSKVALGARHHISAALDLLRPGEGGIVSATSVVREAISACEAQARHTLQDDKITLGQAAKKLAANKNSHPAFVDGISKLYGWTSDEKGIRHASDGSPVSLSTSDAIFFLTIASAFVTWASQP